MFKAEGFSRSGDLGRMDEDGYVRVTVTPEGHHHPGGMNISAREIEDHLGGTRPSRTVAVVGMPDERLGEKACAYVVLADPVRGADASMTSRTISARRSSRRRSCGRLEIVSALPMTATGKVQKHIPARGHHGETWGDMTADRVVRDDRESRATAGVPLAKRRQCRVLDGGPGAQHSLRVGAGSGGTANSSPPVTRGARRLVARTSSPETARHLDGEHPGSGMALRSQRHHCVTSWRWLDRVSDRVYQSCRSSTFRPRRLP